MRGLCAGVSVMLLVLMTACSSDGPGEPSVPEFPQVRSGADISLPLSQFRVLEADYPAIHRAVQILQDQCARRFGARSTDWGAPDLGAVHLDLGRRYGLSDAGLAERYGYHLPGQGASAKERSGGGWNPDEREQLIVTGTRPDGSPPASPPRDEAGSPLPHGGCAAEAWRKVTLGKAPDLAQVERLERESFKRSERDSRVRAAWHDWSSCMAGEGYRFDSPWQPNDRQWSDPVSEAESATARADMRCRERTNLVGIWLAVERAYQRDLIARNKTALNETLSRLRAQAAHAAEVVAEAA
jgi:hypothetical protein